MCIYHRDLCVDTIFFNKQKAVLIPSQASRPLFSAFGSPGGRGRFSLWAKLRVQPLQTVPKTSSGDIGSSRGLETHTGGFVFRVTDSDPDEFVQPRFLIPEMTLWTQVKQALPALEE